MRDLVARVSAGLVERGLTLAVAESCTGGLLSARLTEEEGASRFLLAGLTTYSNDAKTALLGVPDAVLVAHGAVSEPVVRQMVEGARRETGASAAVAITGIAGPGGGTAEKPVGTVWVAAAVEARAESRRFLFDGDRRAVRAAAVRAALEMLDSLMEGS